MEQREPSIPKSGLTSPLTLVKADREKCAILWLTPDLLSKIERSIALHLCCPSGTEPYLCLHSEIQLRVQVYSSQTNSLKLAIFTTITTIFRLGEKKKNVLETPRIPFKQKRRRKPAKKKATPLFSQACTSEMPGEITDLYHKLWFY